MEGAVPFELLRFIDEAILAAKVGVDDAEVVPDGFAGLIKEDDTAGLGCQFVEGFLSVGEERFGFGAEDVDRDVCLLADVDVVFEAGVAGVVDAVGEEEDKVASERVCQLRIDRGRLCRWSRIALCRLIGWRGRRRRCGALLEGVAVACPVLQDLGFRVEAHEEGAVGLLAKELGEIFVRDCLIATEVSEHRSAGVHENAEADGEILMGFERDDLAWSAFRCRGCVDLSSLRSSIGMPWKSATWKVRLTSSTATLRV